MTGTIELIKKFISASKDGDILTIEELLLDGGNYEIEDHGLEIVDAEKTAFLKWYNSKIEAEKITDVIYDQCIGCSFGNHVVLFNNGRFPRIPQEFTDASKAALMFDTQDGKISRIQFCFTFLKTENKYVHDCVGREYVKYIKLGYSEEQAIAMYNADPNSEYGYITRKLRD
jgi:hypothetical protein